MSSKRSLSPTATIPAEDCTRDTFDQHANLSDRQFLSWALQTEARVRFSKLERRNSGSNESTTLNSEYLIDLYPSTEEAKVDAGKLARERHVFSRKSVPYLRTSKLPDSSLKTLPRLKNDRNQSTALKNMAKGYLPIPPNLLYFEIILEAYMGYIVFSFHSPDPTQPRAAVMGGAVVAALTAWRDNLIVKTFTKNETDLLQTLQADDVEKFQSKKEAISQRLHRYFLHDKYNKKRDSPFSLGDVDIFLQASPLTRALSSKLSELPADVQQLISSNVGGCCNVQRDLQKFATTLCDDHLTPQFKNTGNHPPIWDWDHEFELKHKSKFCYALTKNGLSFALGTDESSDDIQFDPALDTWPRTTQLIMLNEKADLVGGLMDFDVSVACCAYDGITVYATPRAAFSLKTLVQVVTPFVFEETRNRRRISKYNKRGFQPFIIDPFCFHEEQCFKEKKTIDDTTDIEIVNWKSRSLNSDQKYNEICRLQYQDNDEPWIFVCEVGCNCDAYGYRYSAALFETSQDDAIRYFSKRDNWSDDRRQEVLSYPEHQRFACKKCREEYAFQHVLDNVPEEVQTVQSVEDVLHGDISFMKSVGDCGDFEPSFYSAGAFNSCNVGKNARAHYQLISVLRGQQFIEQARYLRKHGTHDGHKERFVYGDNLEDVFEKAANHDFPANGRAPVGLNPERFIAKCKGCSQWLHECEFHVQYCNQCEESKPPAIED